MHGFDSSCPKPKNRSCTKDGFYTTSYNSKSLNRFELVELKVAPPFDPGLSILRAAESGTMKGSAALLGGRTSTELSLLRRALSLGEGGDRRPETKTVWTVRCEDRDWPCGVGGEAW